MNDIADWLSRIGLGEYAETFEAEQIGLNDLSELSDADLASLGLPMGPRRRILRAARDMVASDTVALPSPTEAATDATLREPELRQITVLFCDLVGSTGLTARLDPEDLRGLMKAYQQAAGSAIERYEGHVAQYLGDGIVAYFGWPNAHEDDPERAARAAFEVIANVGAVPAEDNLAVRIGISTGVVVISDSGGGDPSHPGGAVGETPHVAARLQALASKNGILASDSTVRLLPASIQREDLGKQELSGVPDPLRIYRLSGVAETASRFEAAHHLTLTPLIGRDNELALLKQRWQQACEGDGQVFLLSGPPGIGKSRIVYEFERGAGIAQDAAVKLQCSPHHQQSAFHPVITELGERIRITAGGDATRRLAALPGMTPDSVALLARLLSVETVSQPSLDASPQRIKDLTIAALATLVTSLAETRPLYVLVEDVQWLDPSTKELIDVLVDRVEGASLFLVITFRPEFQVPWTNLGNVSAYTLSRLSRHDVSAMIARIGERLQDNADLVGRIVAESDCVPLFVEELAKGALEGGLANWCTPEDFDVAPDSALSVPTSLRDSLIGRLDRVPQGRMVAQMAAVISREFSYDLLLSLSDLAASELDLILSRLEEGEIMRRIERGQARRYTFKHALLRDAAYESLLRSNRRTLHGRLAEILAREHRDIATNQPELLAYHFAQADEVESAIRYWVLGGKRASDQSALHEAIALYRHAMDALATLPSAPERDARELDIALQLGLCCIAAHGYAADETRNAFERAAALSEDGDQGKELQALFGLWGHFWMRARHDRAMALGDSLLEKGRKLALPVGRIVGHRALGSTLFTLGRFADARKHVEKAIALCEGQYFGDQPSQFAVHPRTASLLILGWDLWILGYPDAALERISEAVAAAERSAHPYEVAFAHYVASAVHLLRREPAESLGHAEKSLTISTEHHINLFALYSQFGRGCALAEMGRLAEGAADIAAGIKTAEASKLGYLRAFMRGWQATVMAREGDEAAAQATLSQALASTDDVTGRAWEAELHRLKGSIRLSFDPNATEQAQACFSRAILVAREQEARSLELRAACSMAQCLQSLGKAQDARDQLEPVYACFEEGFETADLRDARALLETTDTQEA